MSLEGATNPEHVVWLTNKGGHDYSSLEKYGRVIPLTTGAINPFNPDRLLIGLGHHLSMAKESDYVGVSGLPIVTALVVAMWLERFPQVHLLQWSIRADKYVYTVVKKAAIVRNLNEGGTNG